MNDAVFWVSILGVAVSIIILVYLSALAVKKMNTDHSED